MRVQQARNTEPGTRNQTRRFTSFAPRSALRAPRFAYTLMEMLVVITLIMVLAGLTAMFLPKVNEQARAAEGARQVMYWFETAKQRALRDGIPRGVRLLPSFVTTANTSIVGITTPASRTVTPAQMTGIGSNGAPWAIENNMALYIYSPLDGNWEVIQVTAAGGTNFTATFSQNHQANTATPMLIFSLRCVEAQYIEQMDDFSGGRLVSINNATLPTTPPHPPINPFMRPLGIRTELLDRLYPPARPANPVQLFPNAASASASPVTIPPADYNRFLFFEGVDFSGGFGGGNNTTPVVTDLPKWPVQRGDYLELFSSGLVRRIANVWVIQPVQPGPPSTWQLDPPPPNLFVPAPFLPITKSIIELNFALPSSVTTISDHYRIIRRPRVIGDEKLTLPANIVIDGATNFAFGAAVTLNTAEACLDILFAPSGRVIDRQAAHDNILLWVRDVSVPMLEGDPSIIAIRTRTGAISAHPVDRTFGLTVGSTPPPTPYRFALDPRGD